MEHIADKLHGRAAHGAMLIDGKSHVVDRFAIGQGIVNHHLRVFAPDETGLQFALLVIVGFLCQRNNLVPKLFARGCLKIATVCGEHGAESVGGD